VYDLADLTMNLVVDRQYGDVHTFSLPKTINQH